MTALAEFLFPAPAERGALNIIGWWEARRLRYNLVVGGAGIFSLGVVSLLSALPPSAPPGAGPPIVLVIVYGLLANLCYCGGPIIEIMAEKAFGRRLLPVGPSLFRMGLTFSVGLTLLPAALFAFDWVRRMVFWAVGLA